MATVATDKPQQKQDRIWTSTLAMVEKKVGNIRYKASQMELNQIEVEKEDDRSGGGEIEASAVDHTPVVSPSAAAEEEERRLLLFSSSSSAVTRPDWLQGRRGALANRPMIGTAKTGSSGHRFPRFLTAGFGCFHVFQVNIDGLSHCCIRRDTRAANNTHSFACLCAFRLERPPSAIVLESVGMTLAQGLEKKKERKRTSQKCKLISFL
ncbi:unnamed protein product [Caenorhabditis auriculariae]|uniref:Uncharacterized protein n=1 Tax=Caenorhabditis auriculariae TaxID=2777116 RepID=A0A8S1H044_9PELO|nr:unnamed protein product [Caenorhabditis auriculariae]